MVSKEDMMEKLETTYKPTIITRKLQDGLNVLEEELAKVVDVRTQERTLYSFLLKQTIETMKQLVYFIEKYAGE